MIDPTGRKPVKEDPSSDQKEGSVQSDYAKQKRQEASQREAAPGAAAVDPAGRMAQVQGFFSKYGRSESCSGSVEFGCGQAIIDFTQWEIGSRRLENPSNYWNVVNLAMTQDLLNAEFAYQQGLSSTGTTAGDSWLAFIKTPSPETFWPAHTTSLLRAHFSTAGLSAWQRESSGERDFIQGMVLPAAVQVGPSAMRSDNWSILWNPSGPGVRLFVNGFYAPTFPYTPPGGGGQ